jgi:2'-hydroxyisoflavone reductase
MANLYKKEITSWVQRVATGGEIVAPGDPERPVQYLDARDAAGWLVQMTEARAAGVFHIAGPQERLSMDAFLAACR